jgi:hypothetical protein
MKINYSYRERTVRQISVYEAENAASAYLKEKGYRGLCINATRFWFVDELKTIEEANRYIEQMIDDTMFYDAPYRW